MYGCEHVPTGLSLALNMFQLVLDYPDLYKSTPSRIW